MPVISISTTEIKESISGVKIGTLSSGDKTGTFSSSNSKMLLLSLTTNSISQTSISLIMRPERLLIIPLDLGLMKVGHLILPLTSNLILLMVILQRGQASY